MNIETKKALHKRLLEITLLIKTLDAGLIKAEEELTVIKAKRDDIKLQIDNLQKEKQKIKEDVENV